MLHPRIRRTPPPPDPITHLTVRQLWRDARYQYQLYAHTVEQLDEEIRLHLAAKRHDAKRLHTLIQRREQRYEALRPILQEITRRTAEARKAPGLDIDTQLGYITTRAQAIARAATKAAPLPADS